MNTITSTDGEQIEYRTIVKDGYSWIDHDTQKSVYFALEVTKGPPAARVDGVEYFIFSAIGVDLSQPTDYILFRSLPI